MTDKKVFVMVLFFNLKSTFYLRHIHLRTRLGEKFTVLDGKIEQVKVPKTVYMCHYNEDDVSTILYKGSRVFQECTAKRQSTEEGGYLGTVGD